METLYQENYALINYNPVRSLITLHLIREVNFQDYKLVLNTLLEKIKEKTVGALILDQRYAEDLNIEERAWFVTQWFPRLLHSVQDPFKMVIISSKSLYAKMGSEYIVNTLQAKSKFPMINVDSMEKALKWLETR